MAVLGEKQMAIDNRALAQFADRAIDAPIISVSSAPAYSSSPTSRAARALRPEPRRGSDPGLHAGPERAIWSPAPSA